MKLISGYQVNMDQEEPIPQEATDQEESREVMAYDASFISSSNAISNSFYTRGREMMPLVWSLRRTLEEQYASGQSITDYNHISLYNIFS
jgi:hypothetical protein